MRDKRMKAALFVALLASQVSFSQGLPGLESHNPWDKKRFLVMNEFATPILAGVDVSFFADRNNNFGMGYSYVPYGILGETITIQTLHPRYRWYQAEWYW